MSVAEMSDGRINTGDDARRPNFSKSSFEVILVKSYPWTTVKFSTDQVKLSHLGTELANLMCARLINFIVLYIHYKAAQTSFSKKP